MVSQYIFRDLLIHYRVITLSPDKHVLTAAWLYNLLPHSISHRQPSDRIQSPCLRLTKIHIKLFVQLIASYFLFISQNFTFTFKFPAEVLFNRIFQYIKIELVSVSVRPQVTKRFPIMITPVMYFTTGIITMNGTTDIYPLKFLF